MSELEPTYFPPGELLADIRALIAEARRQTTVAVNMGLTLLYWRIGQRIHREVLGGERAAYGEQIVVTVSRQLVGDYGRGYSEKNLRRMVQFAEVFPEREIVATLWRQLSWSHFSALLRSVSPSNGNLRGDGQDRRLERAYPSCAHRLDALRAHRALETTRRSDPPGTGHPPQQR